jgi:hypothetical protein
MYPGGAQGGGPFASGKSDGAEGVVKQFYDKLMAGETDGMADLFSSKAAGKAKAFRDGKATEEMVTEMKNAFSTAKLSSSKQLQGTHLVVFDENGGGNQASQPTGQYGGSGRSQRKRGKKLQFQVVSESGRLVIKDIKLSDH